MSQSWSQLYVHLIFSSKDRAPVLHPDISTRLHEYLAGIFDEINSHALQIGSAIDHLHSLFSLSKNLPLCDAVKHVKTGSSKWLKTLGPRFRSFQWQAGYGGFSVSQSEVERVTRYIANQAEHHRKRTFQDEYRRFLHQYRVAYDERYVWD
jgi:REP element-mobilizing transposase RayT